jgi:hypothetical protein
VTAHAVPDTILTDDELADIEARAEAATPGPWAWDSRGIKDTDVQVGIAADEWGIQWSGFIPEDRKADYIGPIAVINGGNESSDADFIAHSRSDVSRLLATIRAQRAGLEFYGDSRNYRHTHDWHGQMIVEPSAVDEDGGKRARAILYPEARGGHPCLSAQRAAPR